MPWNSTAPLGTVSVKANRIRQQDNTTYIETTMGNSIVGTNTTTTRDHFWNVGADEDGRHRFMQSPAFTVGSIPTDPLVGNGMSGVLYLKTVTNTPNDTPQWFRKTSDVTGGIIYQVDPCFKSGTINVTTAFQTIIDVPANVYGHIEMFRTDSTGDLTIQDGFFKSRPTGSNVSCNAYAYTNDGGSTIHVLRFRGNGLNLQVRSDAASSGNDWQYRITYRVI